MNFDAAHVQLVTLVGFFEDPQGQQSHVQIPVAPDVQAELEVMLDVTLAKLGLPQSANLLEQFSPAEKYESEEGLKLPLATPYLVQLAAVLGLQNLPSSTNVLGQVDRLQYYYAIFTDNQNRNVWAFRRATQFKGVAKARLAFIKAGLLSMVPGNIFRLDNDFDFVVDAQTVFILRPKGFVQTMDIQGQVLQAAAANAAAVGASINYIDVSGISAYASTHSRSAQLLAAIKARTDLNLIDRNLLESACQGFGIALVQNANGTISPAPGQEYKFLLMIDRRAYTAALIPQQPERYEATSRRKA